MSVKFKTYLVGGAEFQKNMTKRITRGQKMINDVIDRAVVRMHRAAVVSVQKGPKSGRAYKRGAKGTITHIASAPGEAPATDTGALVASIVVSSTKRQNPNEPASFAARTVYAKMLEYGTEDMAARPFMRPAFEGELPRLQKEMKVVIAAINKAKEIDGTFV